MGHLYPLKPEDLDDVGGGGDGEGAGGAAEAEGVAAAAGEVEGGEAADVVAGGGV